ARNFGSQACACGVLYVTSAGAAPTSPRSLTGSRGRRWTTIAKRLRPRPSDRGLIERPRGGIQQAPVMCRGIIVLRKEESARQVWPTVGRSPTIGVFRPGVGINVGRFYPRPFYHSHMFRRKPSTKPLTYASCL